MNAFAPANNLQLTADEETLLEKMITAYTGQALTHPKRRDVPEIAMRALDYTTLSGKETAADIESFCKDAATPVAGATVATVCLEPQHVAQASALLAGSEVGITTVVNFPTGDQDAETVAEQTARAVAAGADEIDVVLPYQAFLDGDVDHCREVLMAARQASGDKVLKVIVESPVLTAEGGAAKVFEAGMLAAECGADFLKTSTGKSTFADGDKRPETDTSQAAALMLAAAVSETRPAVKISGGVKSANDAAMMVALQELIVGAGEVGPDRFRIGASGLKANLAPLLAPSAPPRTAAPAALQNPDY